MGAGFPLAPVFLFEGETSLVSKPPGASGLLVRPGTSDPVPGSEGREGREGGVLKFIFETH